ncbi:MAG TPA: HAMP domain-containing sensor histidine kinase [Mobilitalea sp.]|nr:HAMP domain-containing sensor histidine kinase [Mobilitalea sp.]
MTIKKQWLMVLISVAVFSVFINSLVLSALTNQYFKNYVKTNYEEHLNQIIQYSTNTLKTGNYLVNQMKIELETHLVDPITRIKIYDQNGNLIVDVSSDSNQGFGSGMMSGMMRRMMNSQLEEVDHANIYEGNNIIGQINITKYSSAENSMATWRFQSSLLRNSLYSIGIVMIFAVMIGYLVSRKMSRDLINTANMAQNIEIGNETGNLYSKVKEIRVIQQSLVSLDYKLKLKQKSRKTLIDELVHQTRTPLTIMKTHLEGMEDGIVKMSPEEIKICENQVENITAIIANMSSLIDAEKMDTKVQMEEFEFSQLIRQIVSGLKVQFERKNIELKLVDTVKVTLKTDKYKLSQAIYNILTNAYKYTETNGKVQINYQIMPDRLILTIEDNGSGISEEDQRKIFDAYYKSSRNANPSGEGLGLYVAKENLISMNGDITVESRINHGSKFIVSIPREYIEQ